MNGKNDDKVHRFDEINFPRVTTKRKSYRELADLGAHMTELEDVAGATSDVVSGLSDLSNIYF